MIVCGYIVCEARVYIKQAICEDKVDISDVRVKVSCQICNWYGQILLEYCMYLFKLKLCLDVCLGVGLLDHMVTAAMKLKDTCSLEEKL